MAKRVTTPPRAIHLIDKLKARASRSPDFHQLKFYKKIPVFLYGIEMFGGSDSYILKGSEYLGRAHSISQNFFMKSSQYFPIVFPTEISDAKKAKIRGELYLVSPEHIIALDQSNTNGLSFHRVEHRFILEDQKPTVLKSFKDQKFTKAFMYIGNTQYWKDTGSLKLRPRIMYNDNKELNHDMFYQWVNKSDDDEEYGIQSDEWGYNGVGFWRGTGGNVSNH